LALKRTAAKLVPELPVAPIASGIRCVHLLAAGAKRRVKAAVRIVANQVDVARLGGSRGPFAPQDNLSVGLNDNSVGLILVPAHICVDVAGARPEAGINSSIRVVARYGEIILCSRIEHSSRYDFPITLEGDGLRDDAG
jgi:hypothetical protein